MEDMTPPTSARPVPSSRDTSYLPSAPIPIPRLRRVTDPPPRSPTRLPSSPDLIFAMSPHVPDETPLLHIPASYNTETHLIQKPTLPFTRRAGCINSPYANFPPYWEEPFLYSIPRLPTRPPCHHSRTRSAVVNGSRYTDHVGCASKENPSVAYSSTFSVKSLSSVDARSASCSDTSNSDQEPEEVLTTAFQQSFTSSSSSQSSTSSEKMHFEHPLSPPASYRNEKVVGHPIRMPVTRKKRSSAACIVIPPAIRTSAAEPVVSFAQAELKQSPSSGVIARVVRTSKENARSSFRARSPYPPVRGRRNSTLRSRSAKVSDEDIAGTLEKTGLPEKHGFERFLPAALLRRGLADENNFIEEFPERGRARSRTRPGNRT